MGCFMSYLKLVTTGNYLDLHSSFTAAQAIFRMVSNKSVILWCNKNYHLDWERESEKVARVVQDGTSCRGPLQPPEEPVGEKQAAYHLQERELSEYRRMLECRHRHLYDTGRHLYQGL